MRLARRQLLPAEVTFFIILAFILAGAAGGFVYVNNLQSKPVAASTGPLHFANNDGQVSVQMNITNLSTVSDAKIINVGGGIGTNGKVTLAGCNVDIPANQSGLCTTNIEPNTSELCSELPTGTSNYTLTVIVGFSTISVVDKTYQVTSSELGCG